MTSTAFPVLLVLVACGCVMGLTIMCNHLQNKVERLESDLEVERASHGYFRNKCAKLNESAAKKKELSDLP